MKSTIIFSTYNSPAWLAKVLTGFGHQSVTDFEIIIADDGSGDETKLIIDSFRSKLSCTVIHVWQKDTGFNKCAILNKAIEKSNTEYLIFTDGDCIPHVDFIKSHIEKKEPGYFLSGGYFKLPMEISQSINVDDIISERCFDLTWLKSRGLPNSFKNTKLLFKRNYATVMNAITPTKPSWNGHNSSGWKKDILAINGFDERMKYGSEDREFGERLMNNGIKAKQIRYSAICLHLDHTRGYVNEEDLQKNAEIRATTKRSKATWTDYGIIKNDKVIL